MLGQPWTHPWDPEDEGVPVKPLTPAEVADRQVQLEAWHGADLTHLNRKAIIAEYCFDHSLWRDHGSWAVFCEAKTGLQMHKSQVDELRRIAAMVRAVTEISVKLEEEVPWPTRTYYWRPIVTGRPTVRDPAVVLEILKLAVKLTGKPGFPPRWAEYSAAKDQVLNRPQPKAHHWWPGQKKHLDDHADHEKEEGGDDSAWTGEPVDHEQEEGDPDMVPLEMAEELWVALPYPPEGAKPGSDSPAVRAWLTDAANCMKEAIGAGWMRSLGWKMIQSVFMGGAASTPAQRQIFALDDEEKPPDAS